MQVPKMADVTKLLQVIFIILLCDLSSFIPVKAQSTTGAVIHRMAPGLKLRIRTKDSQLEIFCFQGHSKHLARFFQSVLLNVDEKVQECDLYDGSTKEEVMSEFELHHSAWKLFPFSWKTKNISMAAFNESCVGIFCHSRPLQFDAELSVIRIDYWRVLTLCTGVVLYFSALKLSSNPLFYYVCGVTLGICAGFLILVYLFSKLLPKRPAVYGILIGGWTLGVYLIQMLWENFRTVMQQYYSHVMAYTAFSGLVSFVVCYRFGPVTDPRTRDLIKWALQISGLGMVLWSTQYTEAAVAVILILITVRNFPAWWTAQIKAY